MKRTIISSIFIFFIITAVLYAAKNIFSRWEHDGFVLTLLDNYGTSLSEEVRSNNKREKAYHIFNLLLMSGIKEDVDLTVNLSANEIDKKHEGYVVNRLDIEMIEEVLNLKISREEKYRPVFNEGKLLYLKWSGGILGLEADGLSIYTSKEPFDFIGKKSENILIRINGKLRYLSEVDWVPVGVLDGYTSSDLLKWINDDMIVNYVERDSDGLKFIAVFSVRKPDIELIPDVPGRIIDIVVSEDGKKVYALHFEEGYWKISEYIKKRGEWAVYDKFNREIVMICYRKGNLIWWDTGVEGIVASNGTEMIDLENIRLKTYPVGKYSYSETGKTNAKVNSRDTIVIFYDSKVAEKLSKIGLEKIEQFNGHIGVWLMPVNYKTDIKSLPDKLGRVFFACESMRLYYDTIGRGLRNIESVRLKSTVKEKNIVIFLGMLLLVLIIYEVGKKVRVYTK